MTSMTAGFATDDYKKKEKNLSILKHWLKQKIADKCLTVPY